MTLDPDALSVESRPGYDDGWAAGYVTGWTDAPALPAVHPRNERFAVALLVAAAFITGAALMFIAVQVAHAAAPRPATVIPVGIAAGAAVGERKAEPDQWRTGAPQFVTATSPATRGSGGGAPALASVAHAVKATHGVATWYVDPTPPRLGLYAAVPSWHYGDRPYQLLVTLGSRHVVVWVQDFCACAGRVIDLEADAFARLAPLSRGVIHVTLSRSIPRPPPLTRFIRR